jgi:hypothetical protein
MERKAPIVTNDDTNQLDNELDAALDGDIPALLLQQPSEGTLAYAAFLRYLRMGIHRSLHRVAQDGEHDERHVQRWSAKFGWRARADYFDRLRHRAELRDLLKEVA